jgi:hypothetical protein
LEEWVRAKGIPIPLPDEAAESLSVKRSRVTKRTAEALGKSGLEL